MLKSDSEPIKEALQISEERFRDLTENISDWVWETDAAGVYTYSNLKVKDILGYDPKEIIGKTPFEFMPSEEVKRIAAGFQATVKVHKPFAGLENTNLHKNGQLVTLETSGLPFFDSLG